MRAAFADDVKALLRRFVALLRHNISYVDVTMSPSRIWRCCVTMPAYVDAAHHAAMLRCSRGFRYLRTSALYAARRYADVIVHTPRLIEDSARQQHVELILLRRRRKHHDIEFYATRVDIAHDGARYARYARCHAADDSEAIGECGGARLRC